MEPLKKIKEPISNVPDQQVPVLRIGGSGSATAQIMLYSLQKTSSDVAPEAVDSHALGKPWKNSVLTVDLEYSEKPKLAVVQILGEGLKGMIARNTMSIDRILWGGFRQSVSVSVEGSFQAALDERQSAQVDRYPEQNMTSSMTASGIITNCNQQDVSDRSQSEQHHQKLLSIRQKLVQAVFNNARLAKVSQPGLMNMTYRCSWQVLHVLQNEHESKQPLSNIITLSGTLENAQAVTCGEYITPTWPNAGPFLLQVIGDALKTAQNSPLEYKKPVCVSAQGYVDGLNEIPISIDKAPMTADRLDRPMTLIVRSSLEFQIEVAEILAWLTAAIRTSDSPEMKLSSALLSLRNCCEEIDRFEFEIEPEPLATSVRSHDYPWHQVFPHSVIAVQFPARERFQGTGVDIPPPLMATLAGATKPVEFRGGIILKGVSTALIPVRSLRGEDAIQWHFEVTDSTGGVIQTKAVEAEDGEAKIFREQAVNNRWGYRAYLD